MRPLFYSEKWGEKMAYDGSLIFDTKIDRSGFEKGVQQLGSVGTKAFGIVAKSVAAVGTALTIIGGASIKASIEFESAFAGVRKTVDATEAEFAMLEKGIRDMSKTMPQSASAIAEVAEAAGQLGIRTENILGFTETMIMLGDATNMSSDQAATALARLANITGMSQTDFDKLGSTIVELGNNLATTEAEIVEMGLRLAGTSSQVGLTEHEMLALAGAMSSVGINAEAGGSSMSRVMQKINTEVLSGGKNLSKFAEISNMSVDEFSKAWREKPTEAITAFIKGLDDVNASGGDVTTMLKDLGINSIQEVDTLLRLSGASDVLIDALGMSAKAWEENTALADEASQRYETTESMIEILKNNVNDLAISVGDGLKESFRGGIGAAIEMVQQLADAFEQGGIEGLVEEIGTVLADVVTKVAEYSPKFLEAASNMIMAFIQGIRDNQESIGLAAVDLVQGFVMTMLEIIPEVLVLGIELITTFMQGIAEGIPELVPMAMNAISTILDSLMENLPLILDAGVQIIISLVQGIAEALPDLMTQAIDLIILVADKIIENLPLIVTAGLELLMAIVKGIVDNLPKLISEAPRIINDFSSAIYDQLPKILKAGIDILLEIIKGLIQSIPTLVANIPAIIMAIVNVITLYNWWNLGKNIITNMGNGIKSMVRNMKTIGKDLAANVVEAIKGGFGNVKQLGIDLVKGIWEGISSKVRWIGENVSSFAKGIASKFKDFFKMKSPSRLMAEYGVSIVEGLAVGIKEKQSVAEKAMYDMAQSIVKEYDRLGDAVISALKSRYREEEILRKESLQNEVDGMRKASNARIAQYDKEFQAKLKVLSAETSEEMKALQDQIDTINNKTKEEEKELRDQEYNNKISLKEKEILEAISNEERLKLQAELNAMKAERERQHLLEQREMQINDLRQKMDNVKTQAEQEIEKAKYVHDEKIKSEQWYQDEVDKYNKTQLEKIEIQYKTLLQEENLQAEARTLILDENNTELVELLDSYNPYWQNAGQSFGESLLTGLNSMKTSIQAEVADILSLISEVDRQNANLANQNSIIIQAKKDWEKANKEGNQKAMDEAHRQAEEARASGGTIGNVTLDEALKMKNAVQSEMNRMNNTLSGNNNTTVNNDNGITQNNYFNQPVKSPSETAREIKKVGRELIFE